MAEYLPVSDNIAYGGFVAPKDATFAGPGMDHAPPAAVSIPRPPRPSYSISLCPCGTLRGNTLVLWSSPPGATTFPHHCALGPDWPCTVVTLSLIAVPGLGWCIWIGPGLHWAVAVVGGLLALAALASVSLTAFSDPGILPRQSPEALDSARRAAVEEGTLDAFTACTHCNVLRRPGTQHCYHCQSCVVDLDVRALFKSVVGGVFCATRDPSSPPPHPTAPLPLDGAVYWRQQHTVLPRHAIFVRGRCGGLAAARCAGAGSGLGGDSPHIPPPNPRSVFSCILYMGGCVIGFVVYKVHPP